MATLATDALIGFDGGAVAPATVACCAAPVPVRWTSVCPCHGMRPGGAVAAAPVPVRAADNGSATPADADASSAALAADNASAAPAVEDALEAAAADDLPDGPTCAESGASRTKRCWDRTN